ncbi:MAG: 50S ribosomal protein L18e [Candidatus Micrarchaeota archaeon]|nr:50S ribosomal protein L18e [Candidatus Micrarchaeota archaeon]
MKTGPESLTKLKLLNQLRKAGAKRKLWKRVREILSNPRRLEAQVNLYRLSKLTKSGETVVVPGKLLGTGALAHPLTLVYVDASKSALLGVAAAKGKAVLLSDFLAQNADEKNVKIVI